MCEKYNEYLKLYIYNSLSNSRNIKWNILSRRYGTVLYIYVSPIAEILSEIFYPEDMELYCIFITVSPIAEILSEIFLSRRCGT